MNAWDNLPNATHIDQVLADLKSHPGEFDVAEPARRGMRGWAARVASVTAGSAAAVRVSWQAAAWVVARDAAHAHAPSAAWDTAWDATLALIAWDHSAKYLTMSSERLMIWGELSDDPACVLLLPYVRVRELITAKESVVGMQHD